MSPEREFVPLVLTPKRVAERWHCSERHVRNLVKSRALKSFTLSGKLLRIRVADVLAFEDENIVRRS
jgi:excisionase family DNA binding protein